MVQIHHRLPLFRPRGAARTARLATDEKVAGSNPAGATILRSIVQWKGRSPPKAEIPVRLRVDRPFSRGCGRSDMHSAVYGDETGSTPAIPAIFAVEHEWSSALPLKQVTTGSIPVDGTIFVGEHERPSASSFTRAIAGSIPVSDTKFSRCKLIGMSYRLLTGRQSVRIRRSAPGYSGAAGAVSCTCLLNKRRKPDARSNRALGARFPRREAGASSRLINGRARSAPGSWIDTTGGDHLMVRISGSLLIWRNTDRASLPRAASIES